MYTLKSRSIPLDASYDVIMVGGGPAGCTAAASAAREGAKTLLIEATGSLGGMGTSGLVPAWCPFSDKEKVIYRGMAQTVFERSKALSPHVAPDDVDWVPIDPEALKRIYDELVTEYGVTVLFSTFLCDVDAEDGEVRAIVVSNKAGFTAYSAKTYVDCTGDGDLAVWAGADYEFGENGEPMPSTLCFSLANVDLYAYLYHPKYGLRNGGMHPNNKNSFTHLLPGDARFPDILDTHLCNNIIGPGTIGFNAGHLFGLDSTDPKSVSEAMMRGRRIAKQYRDALAAYFPEAFGNAYLVSTAPVMGVRESRRIVGDYMLTVEDYITKADFEDEVCRNSYYLDIHYTLDELRLLADGKIDEDKRSARYGPGRIARHPLPRAAARGHPERAGRRPLDLLRQAHSGLCARDAGLPRDGRSRRYGRGVCRLGQRRRARGRRAEAARHAPEERRIFPLKFHVILPRGTLSFRAGCAAHRCGNGRIHPAIGRNCI